MRGRRFSTHALPVAVILVVALPPAHGGKYGVNVTVNENYTGKEAIDGGLVIENTNSNTWFRVDYWGSNEPNDPGDRWNLLFVNASGKYCLSGDNNGESCTTVDDCNDGQWHDCVTTEECPGTCSGEDPCKQTTCPGEGSEGCEFIDCCDCGCELNEITGGNLLPSTTVTPSCALPECPSGDCDNQDGVDPWICTELKATAGGGYPRLHVELTEISFDGSCFLTDQDGFDPIEFDESDIEFDNSCSE